jgi:hypothetical protein
VNTVPPTYLYDLPGWLFFNVILALIPLIFSLVAVWMFRIQTKWYKMLKGGELYIFSTTVAASSLGIFAIQHDSINTVQTSLLCALLLIMLLSGFLFAVSAYVQLQDETLPEEHMSRYGGLSVACAVAAAVLGYMISV